MTGGAEPELDQTAKPSSSGTGVKPVRKGSRVVRRDQSAPQPAETAKREAKRQDSWEDQLFFGRLRRHMKWVFAFLAAAFAIGFVVFGVGTGGGGIGDVLDDLFGRNDPAQLQSVQEAKQRVSESPTDPEALLALASAYRATGQPRLQAETLERVVVIRPDDGLALTQLGRAWFTAGDSTTQQAGEVAQLRTTPITSDLCTFPGTSGLIGAICDDPVDQAMSSATSQRVQELLDEAKGLYGRAADSFEKLTVALPDEPSSWLFLASAAREAGDSDAQLAAYEEFLKRFPDDTNAPQIKEIVDQLKATNDTVVG